VTADGDVARLEELLGPRGRAVLARLEAETVTPESVLRISTALREQFPPELVADALSQHELRRQARAKFDRADRMFFTRPGLEQASAEVVARHRAGRYAGWGRLADLCCGIGGDLVTLAGGHEVLAVDRDPVHLRLAVANAAGQGRADRVSPRLADVRTVDLAGVEGVFVDPARRRDGRRQLRAAASEPPLDWCWTLAERVGPVGVKAAPGLPHEAVPDGWEIEFVAVGRDLKEATAWSPQLATTARRATVLPGGHTLHTRPGPPLPVRAPGAYLLDPSPAVTRAGLVQELGRELDAWQLDPMIGFLSADTALRTPFGRCLRVVGSGRWDQKRLPATLRALDVGSVDIRRRGLAGDVDRLHRRLRLEGSRRATVVMTRVRDEPWGLVCLDPEIPA
jgi:SAM-dependent methyltransferase